MTGNIAVITARGGSKRIPRKNIKRFCGKPIIQYSIEAAQNADIFEEIMVSTDDLEIAELAVKLGAKVPFLRSDRTADDNAVTADVILEVLRMYQKEGRSFNDVCCIYPTAPFVTADKLKTGWELLINCDTAVVMPVTAFSFPPQRGLVIKDEKVTMLYPENANVRSQDLQSIYHDCGQFYWLRVKDFLESGKLIGNSVLPMILDDIEVQDIDNLGDWRIAELKYQYMIERNRNEKLY